eukprot:359365-Chlamydomonas_euryale.AAC.11
MAHCNKEMAALRPRLAAPREGLLELRPQSDVLAAPSPDWGTPRGAGLASGPIYPLTSSQGEVC